MPKPLIVLLVLELMFCAVACRAQEGSDSSSGSKSGGSLKVNSGYVLIRQAPTPETSWTLSAAFVSTVDGRSCTNKTEMGCTIVRCQTADEELMLQAVSAGAITVSGGSISPVVLRPDMDGTYTDLSNETTRWNTGNKITVSASGGMVPKFSTEFYFPADIVITSPEPSDKGVVTIERAKGFTATWTAGNGTNSVAIIITQHTISGLIPSATATTIDCEYMAGPGKATVPPQVLNNLKPFSGAITTVVTVAASNGRRFTAGGYSLTIGAVAGGGDAFANVK